MPARETLFAVAVFAGLGFSQTPQPAAPAYRMDVAMERLDVDNWRSVDPSLVLESGDRIRLVFHSNFEGYLYAVNVTSAGKYEPLFPNGDSGQDNHISSGNEYRVPAGANGYRIAGPAGHETVYWVVSPARLPEGVPHLNADPAAAAPHCDEGLLRSRGDCLDTSAGVKPVARDVELPASLAGAADRSQRELQFTRNRDTVVIGMTSPLSGPVIYQFLLAHR
jgi:hypothetical protein